MELNKHNLKQLFNKLKRKLANVKRSIFDQVPKKKPHVQEPLGKIRSALKPRKVQRAPGQRKLLLQKPLLIIGALITLLLALNTWGTIKNANREPASTPEQNENKIPVSKPKKTTEINREFTFSFGTEEAPQELIYKLQKA